MSSGDDYLWDIPRVNLSDLEVGSYEHFLEAMRLEFGAQFAGLVAAFAYNHHVTYSGLESLGLSGVAVTIDELVNHIRDSGLQDSEEVVKFTVGYFGGSGTIEFPEWGE